MKFSFYTLGCKVNLSETQALSDLATTRGHEIVEHDADVCIINTCTVTSSSDHKNIRAFHKARRENPRAVIAACGCFSQMEPEKVLADKDVDLICGTGNRTSILEQCEQAVRGKKSTIDFPSAPPCVFESLSAGVPAGRTRALLKIQDGCDNYCAYCIIPYARGHVRSMAFEEALQEALKLRETGVKELVLTGIEISSYGRDLSPQYSLVDLIEAICSAAPDMRVRLSSLEPRTADAVFCRRLSQFANLMPHFHLSLQSGCDHILQRMNRRYRTQEYYETVCRVRESFPRCSITTDLIVGFPGETDAEFLETLSFIKRCAFADMHIFPYSTRAGTVAAGMPDQIASTVKSTRAETARSVAQEMSSVFLRTFVGQELDVLLEHPSKSGTWSGHAPYHFQVAVATERGRKNQMMRVLVTGLAENGLAAKEIFT